MESAATSGPRRRTRSSARRASILDAAIATFGVRGYEGTSIREIATCAGVQKGLVSYYFPAKQDLLFEIADEIQHQFLSGLTRWANGAGDPRTHVQLIITGHVELICLRANQARVTYENFRSLTPDRRRIVVEKRDLYEHSLCEIVQMCLPASQHATAANTTRAILGMANWVYQWYSPEGPKTPQELGAFVGALAVDALRCKADGLTPATR